MNILCFGELLIKLSTNAHERLDEARDLSISYSGAEAVVAITLAQQGENVAFASRVSNNRLGTNALMTLARYGVDTSRVTRSDDRMGLYYNERGYSIRSSIVTYDRTGTALANATREDFDWDHMLNGVDVFFFSGVIPAISPEMAEACLEGLKACKGRGIHTVFDLNYRQTMWSPKTAQETYRKLLPYVDCLVASDDDILQSNSVSLLENDVFDYCLRWAKGLRLDYPLQTIAFVKRYNDRYDVASFQGALVNNGETYLSRAQRVAVSDISCCGSAFAAAIVHGLCSKRDPQFIVEYATMASAYKATVAGDLSFASEEELASLLAETTQPSIRQ